MATKQGLPTNYGSRRPARQPMRTVMPHFPKKTCSFSLKETDDTLMHFPSFFTLSNTLPELPLPAGLRNARLFLFLSRLEHACNCAPVKPSGPTVRLR